MRLRLRGPSAREELVAELGTAFLCAILASRRNSGTTIRPNLGHWPTFCAKDNRGSPRQQPARSAWRIISTACSGGDQRIGVKPPAEFANSHYRKEATGPSGGPRFSLAFFIASVPEAPEAVRQITAIPRWKRPAIFGVVGPPSPKTVGLV